MKKLILIIFGLGLFFQAFALKDSIGLKYNAGRTYILHKVEPKETLYSLSRRYHVSIDNIMNHNPHVKEGLKIAALLEIPVNNEPVKTEEIDNNHHVVKPSETLFSISRKYEVSVNDLKKWNKLKTNDISIGQKLIIKESGNGRVNEVNNPEEDTRYEGIKVIHTVKKGQTIFSIARKYNTAPGKIKQWNRLRNNNIDVGQDLIVGYVNKSTDEAKHDSFEPDTDKKESESPAQKEEVKEKEIVSVREKNENKELLTVNASDNKKPVFKPDPEIKTYEINDNEYDKNKLSLRERIKEKQDVKKVLENGIAQVIMGSEDTKKYLALHKSAPIGTIMQVKNEMNNLSVFVKVIGRLPDTDENKNILIRITREAYDRLGAIDEKFRVEVSYIP